MIKKWQAKFWFLAIVICIPLNFSVYYHDDISRRIKQDPIVILHSRYPQIARWIESVLVNSEVQNRIAEIILTASPYWHKDENGEISWQAVATLLALGKGVIAGHPQADQILSAIENLSDSYYLDEILARIYSGDKGERRGATAELLNLNFLKNNGIKINGREYDVEVLAASISFTRRITLGKKQYDGLVLLTDRKTGQKIYAVVSSKNKNGLNQQSIKKLIDAFGKDLRGLLKLDERHYYISSPVPEVPEFSQLHILCLISTYGVSRGKVDAAINEINDWIATFSSEQKDRVVGVGFCPIDKSLLTYMMGPFFGISHSLPPP